MNLSIIAAVSKNYTIGINNKIPWNLPTDLKYFKEKTMGHYLLMGRKTFESLNTGLPGREIIVLSRKEISYKKKNMIVVNSIIKGITYAKNAGEVELFISGGAEIFEKTINIVDKIYLTMIDSDFEGDTFFPYINFSDWRLLNSSQTYMENDLKFRFLIYARKKRRNKRDDRDE